MSASAQAGHSQAERASFSGKPYALYTLAILCLVNLLNYFDRTLPSVVLEPIRREFALNDTMLGMMAASFTIAYAIMAFGMGTIADGWSRTRALAMAVLAWSFFTAASGLVHSFWLFFALRVAVGIGEASCLPIATSLLGDLIKPQKWARAYGVFMLGLPLGTFGALSVAGLAATYYGWRATFVMAALPGALLGILLFLCPEPARGKNKGPRIAGSSAIRQIAGSITFWCLALTGTAISSAAYAMGSYLPAFYARVHGYGLAEAGLSSAVVMGVSGLIGLTVGGWLADRASVGRPHGRTIVGMAACLAATPLVFFGLRTSSAEMATGLLFAGWTLQFFFWVTSQATLMEQFSGEVRGRAIGFYVLIAGILSGTIGSGIVGAVSDHFAEAAKARSLTVEVARAIGLQQSLVLIVPAALFIGSIGFGLAAMSARSRVNVTKPS